MTKPRIPFLLLACSLAACASMNQAIDDAGRQVDTTLNGESPVLALSPAEARQLVASAFGDIDRDIPDSVVPRVFLCVDTAGMDAAAMALSKPGDLLYVQLEDAPRLVQQELARQASACGWHKIENSAVAAAMRKARLDRVEDALFLPENRRALRQALGTGRSDPVDHVVYANLFLAPSRSDAHKAEFQLDLQIVPLVDGDSWSAQSVIEKKLPQRGLLAHLRDMRDALGGAADIWHSVQDIVTGVRRQGGRS